MIAPNSPTIHDSTYWESIKAQIQADLEPFDNIPVDDATLLENNYLTLRILQMTRYLLQVTEALATEGYTSTAAPAEPQTPKIRKPRIKRDDKHGVGMWYI